MSKHTNDTAKTKTHSQDSLAKQATDWIAEQFAVTRAIKDRDSANTKAATKTDK